MDAVRTAQYMDVEIVATNRTVAHSTEMVCSGVVNRRILQVNLLSLKFTFSSFKRDVKWLLPR